MKIVLNSQEVLDLVMSSLESPNGQNLLPAAINLEHASVRFVWVDGMNTGGIEISDEPDEPPKP